MVAACSPSRDVSSRPRTAEGAATPQTEPRGLGIGDHAFEFTRASIPSGAKVGLPNGNVTILVFWATWSQPDKVEVIQLQKVFALYRSQGLVVIGVCIDDEASSLPEYVKTYHLEFPIVWDGPVRAIATAYQPQTDALHVRDRSPRESSATWSAATMMAPSMRSRKRRSRCSSDSPRR